MNWTTRYLIVSLLISAAPCLAADQSSSYEGLWRYRPPRHITGIGCRQVTILVVKRKDKHVMTYTTVYRARVKDPSGKRTRLTKTITTEYRNIPVTITRGNMTFKLEESGEVVTLRHEMKEGKECFTQLQSINRHGVTEKPLKGLEPRYYKAEDNQ